MASQSLGKAYEWLEPRSSCPSVPLGESFVGLFQSRGIVDALETFDVLEAGSGWATSILYHERTREAFARFLGRTDRFVLGVCNGCQMLAQLTELIPGASGWPRFVRNASEEYKKFKRPFSSKGKVLLNLKDVKHSSPRSRIGELSGDASARSAKFRDVLASRAGER